MTRAQQRQRRLEIRAAIEGGETILAVADRYGVSRQTAWAACCFIIRSTAREDAIAERNQKIIGLAPTHTAHEIAKMLDMSANTVHGILSDAGISAKRRACSRFEGDARRKAIADHVARGNGVNLTARQYGVSRDTVYKALSFHGVVPRNMHAMKRARLVERLRELGPVTLNDACKALKVSRLVLTRAAQSHGVTFLPGERKAARIRALNMTDHFSILAAHIRGDKILDIAARFNCSKPTVMVIVKSARTAGLQVGNRWPDSRQHEIAKAGAK